jgi:hypothetical protein
VVTPYEYGIGTKLTGHFYRHGTPYPKGSCFVTATGHHTAIAGAAYYQWYVLKSTVAQALYAHKEAVEVHVRNVFFHDKKIDIKMA